MWQLIGIVGVFVAVGAGYTIAGGSFGVILNAVGPELLTILGAGCMTLLIANEITTVRKVGKGLGRIFAGTRWGKSDYTDALCLVFLLVRVARQEGNVVLERHVDNPATSPIFAQYPRLCADPAFLSFVTDVFRTITMNFTDSHKVGEMMETEIERRLNEETRAPKALNTMADALPALGIVAAVLGVIKAMGAIAESPEVLGHMIGSALVGTFLGVFLSYGLVGPAAGRLRGMIEEEGLMLAMVRQVIMSHLEGLAPQLAVEVGRKSVPSRFQPSFDELDQLTSESARNTRAKVEA
jgi:chemotaxis protein MotA